MLNKTHAHNPKARSITPPSEFRLEQSIQKLKASRMPLLPDSTVLFPVLTDLAPAVFVFCQQGHFRHWFHVQQLFGSSCLAGQRQRAPIHQAGIWPGHRADFLQFPISVLVRHLWIVLAFNRRRRPNLFRIDPRLVLHPGAADRIQRGGFVETGQINGPVEQLHDVRLMRDGNGIRGGSRRRFRSL